MVAGLVSSPAFLHQHYPGKLSSIGSASSPSAACSKEQDQFSFSQVLRFGSTTLTLPGLALLSCPGKVQDPLFQLLWRHMSGWDGISSPALVPSGTAHLHPWHSVRSGVLPRRVPACSPVCCSWWRARLVLSLSWPWGPVLLIDTGSKGWRGKDIFPSSMVPESRWRGGVGSSASLTIGSDLVGCPGELHTCGEGWGHFKLGARPAQLSLEGQDQPSCCSIKQGAE